MANPININASFYLLDNNSLDARTEMKGRQEDLDSILRNHRYDGMTVPVKENSFGEVEEYWLPQGQYGQWERKNAHIDCGEF